MDSATSDRRVKANLQVSDEFHIGSLSIKSGMKPLDFYISQWSSTRVSYVFYRGFLAIYWLIWTIVGTIDVSHTAKGKFYYAYLNHWTEWLLVISLIVNTVAAIEGLHTARHPDHAKHLRWYQSTAWLLKTVTTSLSLTVSLLLAPVTGKFDRNSLHRQAVQGAIVGIDLGVSKVPVRLLQFLYVEAVIITYILFTLILHWTGVIHEIYPGILDWGSDPTHAATVCVFVVFLLIPTFQILSYLIHHLISHHSWRCDTKVDNFTEVFDPDLTTEGNDERSSETATETNPLLP